ncbi:flagellar basal body rod protein FlgC [Curtobacterium ammoniigenes]|uniref:flagellar basal body rod protein FlgC n=1 Tax=Curtobacterium ammoniigenes TaxID=395387 RepID=UPI00082CF961|nr:flagellar basal body rod C-terminal domain-containing protein [Curtobacterium ammoniigenes]
MSYDAIGISSTGMVLNQTWLNAISDNLSNINDTASPNSPAFQERFVQATANAGTDGVSPGSVVYGSAAGQLVYDPTNPVANAQGYVKQPTIDMSTQMTDLIEAQRAYQANANAITSAQSMYQSALQIGAKA